MSCVACYTIMHPYPKAYSITGIHLRKVVIDDSVFANKNVYLLSYDIETSQVEYSLFMNGIHPYMGGCSDSLVCIKILDKNGDDKFRCLKGVDPLHDFCEWNIVNDKYEEKWCCSINPKDVLLKIRGKKVYYKNALRGNSILFDVDSSLVDIKGIELHCSDRIVKGDVDNRPQLWRLVSVDSIY